jgi:hypothetical protein
LLSRVLKSVTKLREIFSLGKAKVQGNNKKIENSNPETFTKQEQGVNANEIVDNQKEISVENSTMESSIEVEAISSSNEDTAIEIENDVVVESKNLNDEKKIQADESAQAEVSQAGEENFHSSDSIESPITEVKFFLLNLLH